MRTSIGQAVVLSTWSEAMTYAVEPGPSSRIRFPEHGPYNNRLGYSSLPAMTDNLTKKGFEVTEQAHVSLPMALTMDAGLYPVYTHKDQAGLEILDQRSRAYTNPDSIPDMVWRSLLFIENRELLDRSQAFKNPAVEWDRFAMAAFQRVISGGEGPGGSTLATQLTKVRHSPNGRTDSVPEKLRQMASASLLAYHDGMETLDDRKVIVKEYLNQLPLAATANHGEVNGLGDGLRAWYGSDFDAVNAVLARVPSDSSIAKEKLQRRAVAYRQVLSLLLSTRSPSRFLVGSEGPESLKELTDHYLPLMAEAGIISDELCRAALKTDVAVLRRAPERPAAPYVTQKAANSVRMDLLRKLRITNLPALNRLDLTAHTTFDRDVQQAAADVLSQLQEPEYLQEQGLQWMLGEGVDPENVKYSLVLYERQPHANVLRVQADNVNGPFDVNQGSMLELGSTAKVRVLVTYLELVERVYAAHADKPSVELAALPVPPEDGITQWTVDYLRANPNATREEVLTAAVEREYSGSPAERFFTGGGVHVFQNYSPEADETMTIRDAVRRSANLVFVRMMRDVVNFHIARLPGQAYSVLDDPTNVRRSDYLERFAMHEGRLFLSRYLRAYRKEAPRGDVLDALGARHTLSTRRLAWTYRSVFPEGGRAAFVRYLRTYATDAAAYSDAQIEALYHRTNPSGHPWQDLGYLAGVHPLELWLVAHLHRHPAATYSQVMQASVDVRTDVYQWLFEKGKASQDPRIMTILEQEAFNEIHEMWTRLGYPFDRLVPTLATALGSSADRPAALAELMGILLRDGQRFPSVRVDSLHFAHGTPYETKLERTVPEPVQVLSPELSRVARDVLRDVVERGTAVRARGAISAPDGTPLAIGGKTGTGDNRVYSTGPDGSRTSVAMSRTSTFVFYAGERFFGTLVAYVEGPEADDYRFTSSLTTAILQIIGPSLTPLLEEPTVAEEAQPVPTISVPASRTDG
jgi:membrane peptidoglycan carboxypeptidase